MRDLANPFFSLGNSCALQKDTATKHVMALLILEDYELMARHLVEGFMSGLHRSPFHGFSAEFAEHRIYNPGESTTQHIDWRLYAKTDRLIHQAF